MTRPPRPLAPGLLTQAHRPRRGLSLSLLVLLGLLVGLARPARADNEEVSLSVGGQKTLPADGVQNYSVSNEKLLKVTVSTDGRTLVAKALKPGTVTLVLIHENKAEPDRTVVFNIFARDPRAVMAELNDILRNYPDVQVRQNGPQIVLQGSVNTAQEEARIKDTERNYAGQVLSLVTVGPAGARRNVMVRLDMHYVQIKKRVSRRLGLHYPASVGTSSAGGGGGGTATPPAFTFTADLLKPAVVQASYTIVTDLLPWLDVSESAGYVKVDRVDTLVTENGSEANYRDGSELNIKLTGGLAQAKIEKIFFGSELKVTPRLSAANDAVSLELEADLSRSDSAGTQDGIPGKLISHIRTSIHLPIGQSVMMAGVRSRSASRNTQGLPWLNRIPILGYLFGSEAYDSEDAEGVLFITPTLITATSPDNKQRIEEELRTYERTRF